MPTELTPPLQLLTPPYRRLAAAAGGHFHLRDRGREPGSALIWRIDARTMAKHREDVENRPGGLSLIVILPEITTITADPDMVSLIGECRPHGILPHHERPNTADLAQVLRRPPQDLSAAVTDYLAWRGIRIDRDTAHLIRRTIELSGDVRSITALARGMYLSRRALGRRFMSRGLPVPSHWLQFGRLLRVVTRLQNRDESVFSIAYELGYPDGFSVSNQMQRLVGCRPSEARERLGWEWFMESWLRTEAESGGFAPGLPTGAEVDEHLPPEETLESTQERSAGAEHRRTG